MPASNQTTESALGSQVMKEVFGVTSDQMSSLAMVSSQQNENIAAGSTESTTPVAEEQQEEEEEMEGMSRLLTDEEIQKILTQSSDDASGNTGGFKQCYSNERFLSLKKHVTDLR